MMTVAFVFPGQGSQAVGMLSAAQEAFPAIEKTLQEASDALGYDMGDLFRNGPEDKLALTEYTQPAILTASVALYRVWREEGGIVPNYAAGHSLGEYSALVAAGTLELTDAVKLVRQRGQAMQAAVPVGAGAMAAIIGLDDDTISSLCSGITERVGSWVGAVNFNAPGQVVIAGTAAAVEAAVTDLKAAGAKRALPLPVSAPFHTPLMEPAARVMADALAEVTLAVPEMPVLSNVTAEAQQDPDAIRALLVEQVASPVRWTDCVAYMQQHGCTHYVECGPGKVLSGLIKRMDKSAAFYPIDSPEGLRDALTGLSSLPEA